MASSPPDTSENSEIASVFIRAIRRSGIPFPFPFPVPEASITRNTDDPDHESVGNEDSPPQRVILVNPFTQGMIVINGASSLEALFNDLGTGKTGRPPASKESIEAMACVEIVEDDGGECVVCLDEFEVGGVVKEMPCKHRFHGNCIEKWLRIHGSCPVCRYEMPVEEREEGKKGEEEEGERRRRVGGSSGSGVGEVWIGFSFNGSRRNQDQNQATNDDSSDDDSSDDS